MRTSYYVDRKSSPFDLLNDLENIFKPMFYDVENTAMKTDILEDEKRNFIAVEDYGIIPLLRNLHLIKLKGFIKA